MPLMRYDDGRLETTVGRIYGKKFCVRSGKEKEWGIVKVMRMMMMMMMNWY